MEKHPNVRDLESSKPANGTSPIVFPYFRHSASNQKQALEALFHMTKSLKACLIHEFTEGLEGLDSANDLLVSRSFPPFKLGASSIWFVPCAGGRILQ
jgi:hypothetical protein